MSREPYDWAIVGAGLFGATFAREAMDRGLRVLVVEKRGHIAGNCFDEEVDGVLIHRYGPHIWHCPDQSTWDFVNRFAKFNHFTLRTKANFEGELYSLPINLFTMYQAWGIHTADEAKAILAQVCRPNDNPQTVKEWCLAHIGPRLYEMLVEGYTWKQWGRDPATLPASIIRRLPLRFTMNDNYFPDSHRFQGMPLGGYTKMVENMLEGAEVRLGVDYVEDRAMIDTLAKRTLYTGPIDALYGNIYGNLPYRSLRFEHKTGNGDFQGNAIINYTEREVPHTRISEWKHFYFQETDKTRYTFEYPAEYSQTGEAFYPIRDDSSAARHKQYLDLASKEGLVVGGRLGLFEYTDMHVAIAKARTLAGKLL